MNEAMAKQVILVIEASATLPAQDGQLWREYLRDPAGIFHYEVLVRMKGESGQIFLPDSFLPTAERFNLMLEVDYWVVENAFKELVAAGGIGRIQLSINLSSNTLGDDNSFERIKALLDKYNIPPASIIFEVTETSAIENVDHADGFIKKFRDLGCKFSLDDFGSGFCSFSQLRNLATDFVKIDEQFVKDMARGAMDRAIVTAMNDVAHCLGGSTVAEYVESPEIFGLLKICGVDKVQGYYISKPLKQLPHGNVVKFQHPRHSSKDTQ